MNDTKFPNTIDAISTSILMEELSGCEVLRKTKYGSNDLYVVNNKEQPNIMREIGRLREVTFREAGGGTGSEIDIDESDIEEDGYKQLIVWNPDENEIIGGYRFIVSNACDTKHLSTEHYFEFSDAFRKDYLPYMIELGRSFVQPKYQGRRGSPKGAFALDNLWEGLGAIALKHPHTKYYFGKVTMYVKYNKNARNELIYFIKRYFADDLSLLRPLCPKEIIYDTDAMNAIYCNKNYVDNYKLLSKRIREHGEVIPPLINAYINLSPTLKVFDTVCNEDFGAVDETGILVTINDIYDDKFERYLGIKKSMRKS